ncbi:unnamed protein product [Malus baccata var. baccata]
MPHRTLAELKHKFGPVIWLRVGARNTMVIQSAKAAANPFKNHDISLAGPTTTEASQVYDYHKGSLALAPYGSHWRVKATGFVRKKCLEILQLWIEDEASKLKEGHGVHVARFVFLMSFNLLGNLMLSKDLVDPNSKEGSEWLDPQGLKRKMTRDLGKALKIAARFVRQRMKDKQLGGATGDEPAKISEHDVNIFILEIFLACSETTSSTIEWALTELLCNPEKLIKAKTELTQVIGPSCRKVEEGDIEKLPNLQGIIKETLRLHPPIPFLIPRKAMEETKFMDYFIPNPKTQNPDVWDDEPALFKPERFIGTKWDCKGQHFEFIPFGSGRRVCAGLPLAHRMLHLTLGMFLHQFDWELGGDVTRGNIDWKDKLGITMRKSEPSLNTWSNGRVEFSCMFYHLLFTSSALLDPPEIIEIGSPSASSGPKGWPVLGNMLDLGTMPHRTLTDLGHKFGPVIWLTLGVRNIVNSICQGSCRLFQEP